MQYKPTTIKDTGLKKHLDQTAADHNGLGYSKFLELMAISQHPSGKVNKASIARAFGVDKRTVGNWLEHYEKEAVNG